ncbi:MAG: NYN domain-containing protein [Candidatus Moranbacteria bacterium]|nr:NYN domain-containing protein [Candidatus Moranbacteria bacterium]
MARFPDQRVGVFVDIQNMYYSAKEIHQKKTNFKEILSFSASKRKLIRAIAYGVTTQEGLEEKFFDSLEGAGFELKTKELQIFKSGVKKGDWDVGITVDVIKMAEKLDVVVLVSGDGDYIPLVKFLQYTKGVRVELMAFGESCSHKLIEEVDEFINLSNYKNFFEKK